MYQRGVRRLPRHPRVPRRRRPEGRAAAGPAAGHARADPPGRVHRHHVRRRSTASRSRPDCPGRRQSRRLSGRRASDSTPEALSRRHHHPERARRRRRRRRHHARRQPLAKGDIASRLGGFEDVKRDGAASAARSREIIERRCSGRRTTCTTTTRTTRRSSTTAGASASSTTRSSTAPYLLNPFLVQVELVPMLVVQPGRGRGHQVYVGLPTEDTSGEEFKFGSIVKPGHQGIWSSRCAPASTR